MHAKCEQAAHIQSKIIKELEASPDVKTRFWTDFEIETLKKYYNKKDPRAIAKALNKNVGSIVQKASKLGLTGKQPCA